ncbi:hypothetical protein [Streptomyces viridochromogenes]|uniref:hypothetical protein n=1 Tax=Streptomyces viridochromogenes TaxID=1938 RepID=UPI000AB2A651|nr:hypothetical protein [Streptomyces viridochromogenes]
MGFEDVVDPAGRLKKPQVDGDKDEPSTPYRDLTSYGDVFSPSAVASWVFEKFLGVNPVDEAKNALGGNWEEYAQCAKAWEALGLFCDDLAKNLQSGNRSLDVTWSGNAADAAYVYMDTLAKDIAAMKGSFEQLKEQYEIVTDGVWHAAEACGDLLSGMLDLAIVIGITMAAGASTSWTLVGPVIAAGAVAGEVVAMINLWTRMTTLIMEVGTVVSGATAMVEQTAHFSQASMIKFPLPGKGYDHPGA